MGVNPLFLWSFSIAMLNYQMVDFTWFHCPDSRKWWGYQSEKTWGWMEVRTLHRNSNSMKHDMVIYWDMTVSPYFPIVSPYFPIVSPYFPIVSPSFNWNTKPSRCAWRRMRPTVQHQHQPGNSLARVAKSCGPAGWGRTSIKNGMFTTYKWDIYMGWSWYIYIYILVGGLEPWNF